MLFEELVARIAQPGLRMLPEPVPNSGVQNESISDTQVIVPASPMPIPRRRTINWDDIPESSRLEPGQYRDGLDLRIECQGKPPKKSYLSSDSSPPSGMFPPANAALDIRLTAAMTNGNGKEFLPLNARTIRMMSAYYEGAEPITDTTLFECMMINIEINDVHVDHFNAILGVIGRYCTDLIIVAPIFTTDLGNVFRRDLTDLGSGTDWEIIFRSFPNLTTLTWEHPEGTSTPASRETLLAVHCALSSGRCVQQLEAFKLKICDRSCADLLADVAQYDRDGGSARSWIGSASHLSMAAGRRVSTNGFRMWRSMEYY
jgi:hypothetical protein